MQHRTQNVFNTEILTFNQRAPSSTLLVLLGCLCCCMVCLVVYRHPTSITVQFCFFFSFCFLKHCRFVGLLYIRWTSNLIFFRFFMVREEWDAGRTISKHKQAVYRIELPKPTQSGEHCYVADERMTEYASTEGRLVVVTWGNIFSYTAAILTFFLSTIINIMQKCRDVCFKIMVGGGMSVGEIWFFTQFLLGWVGNYTFYFVESQWHYD